VVGVRRTLDFAGCRPSADFQLPLVTGCAGECQYCYLHTTLGALPYLRLYVNIEEILDAASKHLSRRLPAVTVFEGSATSDPLTVEHYSGSLKQAILYFSRQEKGAFRFATKQVAVDSLLELDHRGKTRARFSLNAESISQQYEKGVPSPQRRIEAALKMKKAGYPVGFLIAPVIIFPGWKEEYGALLKKLAETWRGTGLGNTALTGRKSTQQVDNEPKSNGLPPSFSSQAGHSREDMGPGNSNMPGPAGTMASGCGHGDSNHKDRPRGCNSNNMEPSPTFEIIAHRFTSRAKRRIQEIFPDSTLPLNEEERKFKYGQFGYGKYVYPPDVYAEIRELFTESIATLFPEGRLDYIV
jgi:DNA repair photolyase